MSGAKRALLGARLEVSRFLLTDDQHGGPLFTKPSACVPLPSQLPS
jgi:hypothetical protein